MTERYEFPGVYRVPKTFPAGDAEYVNMRNEETQMFLASIIDLLRSKGYTVIEPPTTVANEEGHHG